MAGLAVRLAELHSFRFQLLADLLDVLDLETNVIHCTAFSWRQGFGRKPKPHELHSRNVARQLPAERAWFGTEALHVPVLHLFSARFGHRTKREMDVVALNTETVSYTWIWVHTGLFRNLDFHTLEVGELTHVLSVDRTVTNPVDFISGC